MISCREEWQHVCECMCVRDKGQIPNHALPYLFFFLANYRSVCYNDTTTTKYASHSQGGVLHNTPDYIQHHAATVPLYLPGVLAARRHSRSLVGSQTEHMKVNCRGKVSNVFSWAAKQMLWMITVLLSVPHFGLFKGYKRYSIWARIARGYQKKRFLCRSCPCKREMVIRNPLLHAWRHSVAVFPAV